MNLFIFKKFKTTMYFKFIFLNILLLSKCVFSNVCHFSAINNNGATSLSQITLSCGQYKDVCAISTNMVYAFTDTELISAEMYTGCSNNGYRIAAFGAASGSVGDLSAGASSIGHQVGSLRCQC